ncbi:hypothetical protein ACSMXN_03300 [Jatrophihabitans sp. DSM 45814]
MTSLPPDDAPPTEDPEAGWSAPSAPAAGSAASPWNQPPPMADPYQQPSYQQPSYPPTGYAPAPYAPPGYPPVGGPGQPYPWNGYPPPAPKSRARLWIWLTAAAVLVVAVVVAVAASSTDHHNSASAPLTPTVADTATTGVLYTSTAGRFRARFPVQPTERSVPTTTGGTQINIVVAVASKPFAEVASETSSATIPVDQYQNTMRIALTSFAAPGNFTIDSQTATTFRGRPARTGTFTTPTGVHLTATVFFYTGTRLYYLVANPGPNATELAASFVALP